MAPIPKLNLTKPIVEAAHFALGDLERNWAILTELLEPGRGDGVSRPLSMQDRERLDALARAERSERFAVPRSAPEGWLRTFGNDPASRRPDLRSALPDGRAPLNLGVYLAQTDIYTAIRALCEYLAAEVLGSTFIGRHDDGMQVCLSWLSGAVPADGGLSGALDAIRDQEVAEYAQKVLDDANFRANHAAGNPEMDTVSLRQACPACGERSVFGVSLGKDHRKWYTRCDNRECLCPGSGCLCLRGFRNAIRPDTPPGRRRHVWGAREWAMVLWVAEKEAAA